MGEFALAASLWEQKLLRVEEAYLRVSRMRSITAIAAAEAHLAANDREQANAVLTRAIQTSDVALTEDLGEYLLRLLAERRSG